MQTTLNIQKRDLNKEEGLLSKIGKIPVQERQFRLLDSKRLGKLFVFTQKRGNYDFISATEPNAR
jgi:hypothetical protein